MSNAAQTWAWKQAPKHASDKAVLVALADNAWEDGSNAWPSVKLLSDKTGLSERTVQRCLQRLIVAEYIAVQAEAQPRRARPTTYQMDLSRPCEIESPGVRTSPPDTTTPGETVPPPDIDDCHQVPLTTSPPVTVTPEPLKNQQQEPSKELVAFRADVEWICTSLRDRMVENGCKPPTITDGWRTAARLLLDRDNRPYNEVLLVLDWSQRDNFWRKNIHSLPTFREKYDRLRMGAQESSQSGSSNMDGFAALIQKFQTERIGGAQ